MAEAGIGFGFLAVVISYLPVLYQAFSRREITHFVARRPRRLAAHRRRTVPPPGRCRAAWRPSVLARRVGALVGRAAGEPLSFPVLSYYRSQHDNQSWVGALTMILDTSALLIAAIDGPTGHQARLTFAMARHAAVDLGLVFQTPPCRRPPTACRPRPMPTCANRSAPRGWNFVTGKPCTETLAELRGLYEPFVNSLADYFQFTLPPFQPAKPPVDNWQTSPWMPCSPGLNNLPGATLNIQLATTTFTNETSPPRSERVSRLRRIADAISLPDGNAGAALSKTVNSHQQHIEARRLQRLFSAGQGGGPMQSHYQPIENYGIIGNMRTAALVGMNGSIDWLCLPHFDSPSVFAAILDDQKGGRFRIAPAGDDFRNKQFYWPDTNILITRFLHADGIGEIEDYMPVGGAGHVAGSSSSAGCASSAARCRFAWSAVRHSTTPAPRTEIHLERARRPLRRARS